MDLKLRHLRGIKKTSNVTLKEEYRKMCLDEQTERLRLERGLKEAKNSMAETKRDKHEISDKYESLKSKFSRLTFKYQLEVQARGALQDKLKEAVKKQDLQKMGKGFLIVNLLMMTVNLILIWFVL